MKLSKSYLLTGLLVLTLANVAWAQPRSFRYWSLGFSVGTMHYQGDLDDHGFQPWIALRGDGSKWGNPLRLFRPAFAASANYHFHPHMFLTLQAGYGWIGAADSLAQGTGSNRYRKFRNLDFRNRIAEASVTLNYEFFATDRHYRFRPNWSPYIFAGLGVYYHNPFTYLRQEEIDYYGKSTLSDGTTPNPNYLGSDLENYKGERIYLQELRTEGQGSGCQNCGAQYSLVGLSIPLGVGVRFKVSDRMDIRVGVGVRKTFTDHLDDVGSYYYADPNGYRNGTLQSSNPILSYIVSDRSHYRGVYAFHGGVEGNTGYQVQFVDLGRGLPINEDEGEKRGFPNQQDWYALSAVTLTYILDPGDRCPKFR